MKILELRFKNLNSLYGEWLIDFTDPEYQANGIFALIGPTGSGKSTILDAICLALYASTPRLGKISGENEIMSRQTGECYAEVVFESQAGIFRCQWYQHRAGKNAAGNLQSARHEIANATSGKILQNKVSLVPSLVEEKTGMDFERFTRSVLLAQGNFDTFLKANENEKSTILEQITGTGIYTSISKKVYERSAEETKALELLKAEISGIQLLDDEQETSIKTLLNQQEKEEDHLKKLRETSKESIDWLKNISFLNKELQDLNLNKTQLQQAETTFQPQKLRLEKGQQAALLASDYAKLEALRSQQTHELTSLKTTQAQLPQFEEQSQQQLEIYNKAAKQLTLAREEQKEAAPLIQRVRLLDHEALEEQKHLTSAQASFNSEETKLKKYQHDLNQQRELEFKVDNQLTQVNHYLTQHAQDEWLISGLAAIEIQLHNLARHQQNNANLAEQLNQANAALTLTNQQLEALAKKVTQAEAEVITAKNALQVGNANLTSLLNGKLLREHQSDLGNKQQELIYLNRISDLETQRSQLQDGEACPLCGAKEHPFAQGNIPTPNAVEEQIKQLQGLIQQAESLQETNRKLEQAQAIAENQLLTNQNAQQNAVTNLTYAEQKVAQLKDQIQQEQVQLKQATQQLINQLQPLGISKISAHQADNLITSLRARLTQWQEHSQLKTTAETQLNAIASEIKHLLRVIEAQKATLTEKLTSKNSLESSLNTLTQERWQLYANKDPIQEEERLATAISQAEQIANQAQLEQQRLQQVLTTAQAQLTSTKNRLATLEPQIVSSQQAFLSKAKPLGFVDEATFIKAQLNSNELTNLANQAAKLNETKIDLAAKQQDREKRLKQLTDQNLTQQSLEELQSSYQAVEQKLQEINELIHGYKHQLIANQEAKAKLKEKQLVINQQTRESDKWQRLNQLIGSQSGSKFSKFAQGLTFEFLIAHANQQLEKMSDRYLLINDSDQPLELNIIDNYQAGEVRSIKNLSGGESFIISLSLALGLSKMASDKVQVDSLFLDEGFGTLDEDALDTALETLSNLQEEGKLIGVISHVAALKDRIATQIAVIPLHGGRSQLKGPGCQAVTK